MWARSRTVPISALHRSWYHQHAKLWCNYHRIPSGHYYIYRPLYTHPSCRFKAYIFHIALQTWLVITAKLAFCFISWPLKYQLDYWKSLFKILRNPRWSSNGMPLVCMETHFSEHFAGWSSCSTSDAMQISKLAHGCNIKKENQSSRKLFHVFF